MASPAQEEVHAADQPAGVTIPIDTDESDSAYAESTHESDTESLASSILKYRWEHGRRYHAYKDGQYWGPNDDKQLDAEDFVHQMFLLVLDTKLFLAPLEEPKKVLDIGTGSGIWAIDFADQFPSAEVIGVDLSPVQPSFVPPNCRFEIEDVIQPWTYPLNSFDYIHLRMMTGSIPNWTAFYKKVYQHLKPGAWVEQLELSSKTQSEDGTVREGNPQAFTTWAKVFKDLGDITGKTFQICEEAKSHVIAAGFTNVQETRIKIPIGPWSKDEKKKQWGLWNRVYLEDALEGFALRGLTSALGWSYEETQVFFADMRSCLRDPALHAYIDMSVVTGQKPLEPKVAS